jgi:hypothetical protein
MAIRAATAKETLLMWCQIKTKEYEVQQPNFIARKQKKRKWRRRTRKRLTQRPFLYKNLLFFSVFYFFEFDVFLFFTLDSLENYTLL